MGIAAGALNTEQLRPFTDLFLSENGFCFDNSPESHVRLSRGMSALLKIPVVFINLGDLDHGYDHPVKIPQSGTPAFTSSQIKRRARQIKAICQATLPDVDPSLWKNFRFTRTASNAGPVADTLLTSEDDRARPLTIFEPRMSGKFWNSAAVVLLPDRNWDEKTIWAYLTGLDEKDVVNFPQGPGLRIQSVLHEIGHLFQRVAESLKGAGSKTKTMKGGIEFALLGADSAEATMATKGRKWAYEADADICGIDLTGVLTEDPRSQRDGVGRSLSEARERLPQARAISRFLFAAEFYDVALAADAHLKGQAPPPFASAHRAGDEVIWKTWCDFKGIRRQFDGGSMSLDDSEVVQRTTDAYRRGHLRDLTLLDPLSIACDGPKKPEDRISLLRVLHDAVKGGRIGQGLSSRMAELVLDAARFTNPQILDVRQRGAAVEIETMRRLPAANEYPTIAPHIPASMPQPGTQSSVLARC